ncbi:MULTISPECIES: SPIN family peroxidase inhibitor [Mammaliicoccus]|uniref:SPIN family peroxidase inhibitor n=1 Tax=Mammaliicoccus sciuri TaxID=1296 RepID=A0AAJ4SJK5_MAMSC|nr:MULTISPECIES: SPIN family peroxidase inhibitor [Mammaliicoccus]MBF9297303.1 SPIN family peroxidase inhibitor [Staphylococcus schleiferi]MCJ0914616.1 SPIN family peroxidase inhibitor [Mammaliicoccus sciuri]MCJ0940604.1 SPIN family peroxidase inhibitor [Mammaliicoccus sciuri]MCJ0943252.1 SPIN family peroxidase inhibitor [Mammaliicoccus sciuri]MCJ0965234.1 SPIN family peroxidase inhibitor [Mammaliicoccus sciuri]
MKFKKLIPVTLSAVILGFGAVSVTDSHHADAKTHSQNGLTLHDDTRLPFHTDQDLAVLLNKDTDTLTKQQLIDYFKLLGFKNVGQVIKTAEKQNIDVSAFHKYRNHKGWK